MGKTTLFEATYEATCNGYTTTFKSRFNPRNKEGRYELFLDALLALSDVGCRHTTTDDIRVNGNALYGFWL